jgi:hypothetical protein
VHRFYLPKRKRQQQEPSSPWVLLDFSYSISKSGAATAGTESPDQGSSGSDAGVGSRLKPTDLLLFSRRDPGPGPEFQGLRVAGAIHFLAIVTMADTSPSERTVGASAKLLCFWHWDGKQAHSCQAVTHMNALTRALNDLLLPNLEPPPPAPAQAAAGAASSSYTESVADDDGSSNVHSKWCVRPVTCLATDIRADSALAGLAGYHELSGRSSTGPDSAGIFSRSSSMSGGPPKILTPLHQLILRGDETQQQADRDETHISRVKQGSAVSAYLRSRRLNLSQEEASLGVLACASTLSHHAPDEDPSQASIKLIQGPPGESCRNK